MSTFYVDLNAGSNGSGTSSGSPFNNLSSVRSSGATGGDTIRIKATSTISGSLDLGTLAGSSWGTPLVVLGVNDLSNLTETAPITFDASGQSYGIIGGSNLVLNNFSVSNATTAGLNLGSGTKLTRVNVTKGSGSASTAGTLYTSEVHGCNFSGFTGTQLTLQGVANDCGFSGGTNGLLAVAYGSLLVNRCKFHTFTSGYGINFPGSASSQNLGVMNCSFYDMTDAIQIDGGYNGSFQIGPNNFQNVTGYLVRITGTLTSSAFTVIGHRCYSVGATKYSAGITDSGTITTASPLFVNAPTDMSVVSPYLNTWNLNRSFFAVESVAGGGGGGGIMGHGLSGGF